MKTKAEYYTNTILTPNEYHTNTNTNNTLQTYQNYIKLTNTDKTLYTIDTNTTPNTTEILYKYLANTILI